MISQYLIDWGLTRDSLVWFWGRIVSGSLLIASGVLPLDKYLSPTWQHIIQVTAVIVLWFSGKYDSSPLPGKK